MSITPPLRTQIKQYAAVVWQRYRSLHVYGKLFIWLVALFYVCLGAFIIVVTPSRIAQFLYDQARRLAEYPFGWLLLTLTIVCISFPPFVGHTTLVSLCGFAYGMKGFFIAAFGSFFGSALSFSVLRLVFRARLQQWSAHNDKWQALESVVREKGLLLIILIRVSPFPPWVYSNSLFASIEAVSLWQFVVATLFISPKLLLHTFIGSRLAALSDGDQRGHMDTQTKVLNGVLVVGGVALAIFTSWWIYNSVQTHIRHMEGIDPEVERQAADAVEEFDEEAPLLPSYT